jgi:site-specific DNA-methyltransferase (adenine-specific)
LTIRSLYYGNNLEVMKNEIADETADLIYLDPPFNSKATYNVLFRSPTGGPSKAQIEAFDDTWHWGLEAEEGMDEVAASGNTDAADLLRAMRQFLGENDMMAYLANMGPRLLQLHRVLKANGSLFLHCDPTASHYLKLLLDSVFGPKQFRNEIVWAYYGAASPGQRHLNKKHDTIFWYTKGEQWKFYPDSLRFPFAETTKERAKRKDRSFGKVRTRELQEYKFPEDWWPDIRALKAGKERLGYQTQKPLKLLRRIIEMTTDEGDLVLDPFCGCGTTIHAAESLRRQWIGIDITHLAIGLIELRLKDAFPGITYEIHGTPKDLDGAKDLAKRDKYQFQWWAVSLVDAQPYKGKKKGADKGIDGLIYFRPDHKTQERAIVSVKSGGVSVPMIRELRAVMGAQKAPLGVLLTLGKPTGPMRREAAAAGFYGGGPRKVPKIQILTVEELLAGKRPDIPLVEPRAGFTRAERERRDDQLLLVAEEEEEYGPESN